MDLLAHGLWAAAGAEVLRRRSYVSRVELRIIVPLALFPDLPQMLPLLGWLLLGDGSLADLYAYAAAKPGTEPWLPPIVQSLVNHLHCVTHSAVIAGGVTLLVWRLRRRWLVLLLGWWSHIVIDVFTHSSDYYAVPVLYPITDASFDGIAWNSPLFMLLNYLTLAGVYVWLYRTKPAGT